MPFAPRKPRTAFFFFFLINPLKDSFLRFIPETIDSFLRPLLRKLGYLVPRRLGVVLMSSFKWVGAEWLPSTPRPLVSILETLIKSAGCVFVFILTQTEDEDETSVSDVTVRVVTRSTWFSKRLEMILIQFRPSPGTFALDPRPISRESLAQASGSAV